MGSETSPCDATSGYRQDQRAAAKTLAPLAEQQPRVLRTSDCRMLLAPPCGPRKLRQCRRTDSPRAIRNRRPRSGTSARSKAAHGSDSHDRPPAVHGNGQLSERARGHARRWPPRGQAPPHDHGHTSRSGHAAPLAPPGAPRARPSSWLRCDGAEAWKSWGRSSLSRTLRSCRRAVKTPTQNRAHIVRGSCVTGAQVDPQNHPLRGRTGSVGAVTRACRPAECQASIRQTSETSTPMSAPVRVASWPTVGELL